VVLEELNHALARGAKIYAEVTGYGATSDGHDMVAPSGEGGERSMRWRCRPCPRTARSATSTPTAPAPPRRRDRGQGHPPRLRRRHPPISSTKSLTGHSLGATGVHEAIYCLLMMQGGFIAASANVTTLDPALRPRIRHQTRDERGARHVLSNSFGFGGTNATLVMSKYQG
jgi:3-oxoacyl-[acyl-carrier-protein] synthase I